MVTQKISHEASQETLTAAQTNPNPRQCVLGNVTCFIMIVAWLVSLVTPLCLITLACFSGDAWKQNLAIVMSVFAFSYAPWPCSHYFRAVFASGGADYFKNFGMFYEEPFVDPSRPAKLLCVHPHGLIAMGWGVLFNRPELEKVRFVFSPQLYWSPAFHLFTKVLGHPHPSDKKSFIELMRSQATMALLPGGFEEATIHSDEANRVYIKRRCGFVKYALQFGYELVPCYCFGENKTFKNSSPWGIPFGFWLNTWGSVGVVGFGRWRMFPFMPRNEKMYIVVGKALQLPRIKDPSPEQIHEHHSKYIEALVGLYERHKVKAHEHGDLELW